MRLGLTGLYVVAALLAGRAAHANCAASSGRVLWTYPTDGAVGVPTNTRLLVTDDGAGNPSLNDVPLRPDPDGSFDLGALAPNTTYRVTWGPLLRGSDPQTISFTTGAGPSSESAPAAPEPLYVRRNPSDYQHCPLVGYQDCFDTGGPQRVSLAPAGDALAWLVEGKSCSGTVHLVWPAECGPPVIEARAQTICVSLRATDGVHTSERTQVICSLPAGASGSTPQDPSFCPGVDFPPTGALLLPAKDDVPCASDGTSVCVDPPPSPPPPGAPASSPRAESVPPPMAAPPTDIVAEPRSSDGCSLDPGGRRSGAEWLAVALACSARLRRRRQQAK